MKKIVTTIIGASLLAGTLYAAGDHQMDGIKNMNNMSEKQIQHCNDLMKHDVMKKELGGASENILDKLYPSSTES
ncbi:MAG: hypothetical protein C0625_06745 [Arcobacter sp.]|nr:MAG: hypothetical protein C0625_06745 [Arcobacter sp.]